MCLKISVLELHDIIFQKELKADRAYKHHCLPSLWGGRQGQALTSSFHYLNYRAIFSNAYWIPSIHQTASKFYKRQYVLYLMKDSVSKNCLYHIFVQFQWSNKEIKIVFLAFLVF